MNDTAQIERLAHLEALGEASAFAARLHALIMRSPLFENLSLAEIELLSRFMLIYRSEAGTEIIREGEPGDFMMFMLEGRAHVLKRDRWNASQLIAVLDQGKMVGEMSMIDGAPRFATCLAAERCLLAVLTRESLARIILEQPLLGAKILMELVLTLSQRLRQTSEKLVSYMDRESPIESL